MSEPRADDSDRQRVDDERHLALGTLSFALCFAAWGLVSAFAVRFRESFHLLDHLGLREPEQSKPPPPREILRAAEHGEGWGVRASWD